MTIVTSSFSVHTKTKSQRFEIPPVLRAFPKNSVFVTDFVWTEGLTIEMNSPLSNFSSVVSTIPQ